MTIGAPLQGLRAFWRVTQGRPESGPALGWYKAAPLALGRDQGGGSAAANAMADGGTPPSRGFVLALALAAVLLPMNSRGANPSFADFNTYHFSVASDKVSLLGMLTNQVTGVNVLYPTNAGALNVNLNQPYADLNQAANFSFTGVANVSSTNYQTAVVFVGNTAGGTITIGVPANTHTQGTWLCTNVTAVSFFCSAGRWTNAVAVPLW